MRAIWSVRPKCSHRRVSLKETPLKTCENPQAHDEKLYRANRYENKMVKTYRDLNCSGASPILGGWLDKKIYVKSCHLSGCVVFFSAPRNINSCEGMVRGSDVSLICFLGGGGVTHGQDKSQYEYPKK